MDNDTNILKIEMADGSLYEPPGNWARALLMKAGEDFQEVVRAFQDAVKNHYEQKTVPTKFGLKHSWGDDEVEEGRDNDMAEIVRRMRTGVYDPKSTYEDHADLAPSVLYPYIRGALMGLAMDELDEGEASVVEIGENGVVEYCDGERTDYDSLRQYRQQSND